MQSKTIMKDILKKNDFAKLIIAKRRVHLQKKKNRIDDYRFICKEFQHRTGRELNLRDPKRFTEKLQWLKLFYRNDLMPLCADKSRVVEYLSSKGYEDLLVESYGCWDNVESIPIDELPERFIIKATHGSSMHLVVRDKRQVNWTLWKKIMRVWLDTNIAIDGREWPYRHVKPQLRAEKLLMHDEKLGGTDYKFFCFHGQPAFVQVDSELLSNHSIDFFDKEWNHLDLKCQFKNCATAPQKPACFLEMIRIAKELAKPFPHVRVDFLLCGKELYLSELTFFDGSGFYNFHPDGYDFVFGEKLILPQPNYNLELFDALTNKVE